MKKTITITLDERRARNLGEHLLLIIKDMDKIVKETGNQRTKKSADELEEIRKDIMDQVFSG